MRPALAAAVICAFAGPAAADKPVLTVYAYDSFVSEYGPGPAVERAFEAECDCDLEFVAAGDGAAMLGRLRLEGADGRADVALGLDQNLIADAAATGLFAEHGIATDGLSLPVAWSDPRFLPFDWGWFAFVYDQTRLPNPPTSFEELLAAPEDVTLILQDPRTSTPGLGLALWVQALYGDRAADVWARLAPRVVTVTKGWWEGYSAFLEGESTMVLSYTTSPAYHVAVEGDATKKAAPFAVGHYMQIEVAGRLAASDQPDLAKRFLRFMLTPAVQSAIPETNWMYPAAPAGPLPSAFDGLIRPSSVTIPSDDIPALRKAAIDAWREGLTR
jgi:thiamine transport system substrate-binding protein